VPKVFPLSLVGIGGEHKMKKIVLITTGLFLVGVASYIFYWLAIVHACPLWWGYFLR